MMNKLPYDKLDKHFTAPNKISPFFNVKRVPRKFKKKWRHILTHKVYKHLTLNQKLWFIQGVVNPNYNKFLIKQTK